MNIVILAGGKGTRLQEETRGMIPKPMVEIGGRPMVEHIAQMYANQIRAASIFIASGFKSEVIDEWLTERGTRSAQERNYRLVNIFTGENSATGYRIKTAHAAFSQHPSQSFMATYGDGLSDLSFHALGVFHVRMRKQYGVLATLTAVRPPSRFGAIQIEGGMIRSFEEKPNLSEGWINGGFYVIEPEALELVNHEACQWERDVLPILAQQGRLAAFQHPGWWQMCDTPRDLSYLQDVWQSGSAPWTRWGGHNAT